MAMATVLTYGLFASAIAGFICVLWWRSAGSVALLDAMPFAPASAATEVKSHLFFDVISALLMGRGGVSNSLAMVRTRHWCASATSPVGRQHMQKFTDYRRWVWFAFGFLFVALFAVSLVPR